MDDNMQLVELRQIAKDKGLKNISKLKKSELIELLEDYEKDKQVEEDITNEEKEEFVSGNRRI